MVGIIAPPYGPAGGDAGTPELADMDIPSTDEGAGYELTATGDIFTDDDGTSGFEDSGDDWIAPQVGMSGFDVRATLVSGAVAAGLSDLLSTWLPLSADRKWKCKVATPLNPAPSCELTIEIRPTGGVTVVSCTVTMSTVFTG